VAGNYNHDIWKLRCFFIAVFMTGIISVQAQKSTGYNYVSKMMYRIPESLTHTTDDIAGYVNASFLNDKDKSRAIFIWIARNIKYNFDSIITNSIYETPSEVSERILRTRTGVCLNFAHLFNELCIKTGIKSYIVQGYTKQGGRVDYLPHIWCAAFIDTAWYLFDPTWGSGYYSRGKYVSQVNGFYFMAKPEILIRSHIPFDPMWQFLNYPISHNEFKKRNNRADTTRRYFSFADTLRKWEQSTDLERAISSARRIEQSGVTNNFVAAKLRVVKGDVEYLRNKLAAEKYDTAVSLFNEGIRALNRFINLRNEQLNDSLVLTELLDTSESHFNSALLVLNEANGVDAHIISSVNTLKNEINSTRMMLNLQRASFLSYLKSKY